MAHLDPPHTVTRDDDDHRYEIRLGGVLAGFAEFEVDRRGRLRFVHTEIDPAFEGRGLGSTLVREAMTDVARRGETVVPVCPFVASFLTRNDVPGLDVAWPRTSDPAPAP